MSRVSFDPGVIKELCAQHDVPVPSFTRDMNKTMRFDGLPNLSFLMDVAFTHQLDPDELVVRHNQEYGGCDTCGPGPCEFEVTTRDVR